MFVKKFEIENYKSFLASGETGLSPGFNVIVGPNNAGKTALIEALELRFENHPHRSQRTAPNRNSQPTTTSRINVTFQLGRDELAELLADEMADIHVPASKRPANQAEIDRFVSSFINTDLHLVHASYSNNL